MEERTRSKSNSAPNVVSTWSRKSEVLFTKPTDPQGWQGSGSGGPYTLTYCPTVRTQNMTDIVNSGFDRRRAAGEVILSPMTSTIVVEEKGPAGFDLSYETRGGLGTAHPQWLRTTYTGERPLTDYLFTEYTWPTALPDIESLKQQALAKAFSNISATDALILASLGEAKETITSARKTLKTVIKLVKKFKQSKLAGLAYLARQKGNYDDVWMWLRYELRPLYYDIKGAAAALSHNAAFPRQTFRGYAHDSISQTTFYNKTVGGVRFSMRREDNVEVHARGGVLTEVGSLNWMDYFGVLDVAESVWELVPFSFIVDWFCNVGMLISSWTPNPKFRTLGSWVTVETVTTRTITVAGFEPYPVYSTDKNGSVRNAFFSGSPYYRKSVIKKQRFINPERAIFPIQWKLPLDIPKLYDLVIILGGLDGRH